MRNYHQYTDEEREYLVCRIPETTYAQAARDFEARFGVARTVSNMADFASRHGISSGYNSAALGRVSWTREMDDWLRSSVPGRSEAEVIAAFEGRFGIGLRVSQLKSRLSHLGVRHGINTGRIGCSACRIEPGWNKGMPIESFMSQEAIARSAKGRYRKGNVPHNRKPLGCEYVDEDGYVFVKVAEAQGARRFGRAGNWRQRSRIVYEREHGAVPDGCVVMHADRDPANDEPGNLVAVDKRDYAVMMNEQMQYFDRESLEACVAIAKLKRGCYGASRQCGAQ